MNGDVTFFIFQYDVIETFMNFIIHTKRFFRESSKQIIKITFQFYDISQIRNLKFLLLLFLKQELNTDKQIWMRTENWTQFRENSNLLAKRSLEVDGLKAESTIKCI